MNIGERMLMYRAKNNLTQIQLANLLGEKVHTIFNCENNCHKPHKANEIRLEIKMNELEEKGNV